MATPRGITQPHTSFIGSACQGIHHTPVTKHTDTQTNRYKHQNTKKKDTRVHYTVLTQHNPTHNQPQQRSHVRRAQQEQPMLPQTPNSAPTKNPFCHAIWCIHQPNTTQHTPQPGTNTTIEAMQANLRVCLHPAKTTQWQSHTRRLNHTHPQLWAHKIKAP